MSYVEDNFTQDYNETVNAHMPYAMTTKSI